ncbi:uncharacterized protein LOC120137827 [Hibiscus syriacus]|uniref:uncharacterized protein LOC120137827 n=1 Tax=Hibiscus syriacus TaxID=106335 RepID=UPI0019207196|nr:uncharacterized protein LOC120137827 [Hibiscus syriacus]
MADYAVDSDSQVGSKRRTSADTDQKEETLLQLPSSLSETTADRRDSTPPDRQEETAMDHSSPKKAKCFPLLSEGNQEMGLHSFTQKKVSLSGLFEKEKVYDVETKEGSFGVQEVGSQVNSIEADNKGKDLESETVLEAEKKRLLDELEVENIFGGTKGLDLPVKGSLMIEVIDDTALIGSFPLSRTGNGEKKKGEHEIDCTKTKRSRRKRKNVKKVLGESGTVRHVESTEIFEVQNGKTESGNQNKIMYSRKELESLRFANGVEQRNFWRDVYKSLGKDVIREYEDLGRWKHQKKISSGSSSDTRHDFAKKTGSPAIIRENYSENVGNELEYMEDNEMENIFPFGFTSHDVEVEDAVFGVEEECIEDDDSDEDYTTILRPAFMVEGEPDFDSGPPEDGLEYLRRVRWEAAQIPKIKIAKPHKFTSNKEQSVYMPQIPEIADCPEHLLPLKQWEEAFLADFLELRMTLSHMEDPSAEVSCKLPRLTVQADDLCRLPEGGAVENFNHATGEVHSDQVFLSKSADEISLAQNNPCPKTCISDTCGDFPTLSAIRKMDSVARVSMLRKQISSVENMSSLSRSNCVWLFALCAAIDTPLDADTCASLRSLLRKCANLRAGKSEVDDEVIMLNILATVSGRYFGQSET